MQKSDAVGAGSVVMKKSGRPRKKQQVSTNAKVMDAVDWMVESEGNEHTVTLDSSTKMTHRKRSNLLGDVESVNYMLPEDRNKAMASFFIV